MTRRFLLPRLALLLPLGACAAGAVQQAATNETAPGGPGRLCLRNSSIELLAGDTVREAAGSHGLGLEISGPAGRFTFAENEAFAESETAGEPVAVRVGLKVTRHLRDGRIAYLFRGPGAAFLEGFHDGDMELPLTWIWGPAIVGGPADLAILSRVGTGLPEGCTLRYDYGFEDPSPRGNTQ